MVEVSGLSLPVFNALCDAVEETYAFSDVVVPRREVSIRKFDANEKENVIDSILVTEKEQYEIVLELIPCSHGLELFTKNGIYHAVKSLSMRVL